jgi:acetyl esterase
MTLHPQAEAAIALWAHDASVTDPGFGASEIAAQRRLSLAEAATEAKEAVDHVEDVDADGVPCRLYRPGDGPGTILFLHGGGFVFGDIDTHDSQARRLANRTGMAVMAVDYRRPPEHRFPAAPDDVDTALVWLQANGHDRSLVALGDSAGGNLALVAALRNPGAFAATVLVYPFIDPQARFPSYRDDNASLTAGEARWYWQQYAPDDLAHPDVSPIDSTALGTLPPTLVIAAEHDVLLDEDEDLARRIERAGAAVRCSTYPGMIHGFWRHPGLFDAAEESTAEIAEFLRRTI